jgi:low temperature requirement protein LtrA
MTDHDRPVGQPWRRPMAARDSREVHRQSSFLELFFDLCFVVAVAAAAARLHQGLAEDLVAAGVIGYLLVFFSIWWAWMSFTWFASAYEVDDVPYRLSALVQITGALILAAGVPRAFDDRDFSIVFIGYGVMRAGLIAQRLRAARADPPRRTTMLRYASGEGGAMLGWATVLFLLPENWLLPGWLVMAGIECAVPLWAERAGQTTWHPHHIAERYGLFTIIVLGESVLAATIAVQSSLNAEAGIGDLVTLVTGGLLIVFSMWWLYFSKPAYCFLTSNRAAFLWGYGHYFIYASAAAVGAGLALNAEHATGHTELSDAVAGAAVTIPVAVFLCMLWVLHIRPQRTGLFHAVLFPAAAAVSLAATFSLWPILITGLAAAVLVTISIVLSARDHRRSLQS